MKKLWLGRSIIIPSFYHSLDPRVKILMMGLNIIMMLLISTASQLLLVTILIFIFLYLSKIPFSFYMKQIMFFKYMYLFFLLFFTLTEGTLTFLLIGPLQLTLDGLLLGGFYTAKMMLFILMGALLTFTTTPSELVTGMRSLIKGKSMEQFTFMVSLAIRLIPMILDEVKLIYSAQQSRGLEFSELLWKEKLSRLLSIIIPAISNTVKRLTMMMDAMECRGYIVGQHRTSIHQLKWKVRDTWVLVSGIVTLIGVIVL